MLLQMFLGLHFSIWVCQQRKLEDFFWCLDLLHPISRVSERHFDLFSETCFSPCTSKQWGKKPGSSTCLENCVVFPAICSVIWNVNISQDWQKQKLLLILKCFNKQLISFITQKDNFKKSWAELREDKANTECLDISLPRRVVVKFYSIISQVVNCVTSNIWMAFFFITPIILVMLWSFGGTSKQSLLPQTCILHSTPDYFKVTEHWMTPPD